MADSSTEAAPAADVPQVTFKKRSAKSKTSLRKKAATPPPAAGDSDSDFTSSDDDEGRRIKRRRKNATVTASSASNNATAAALRKADDDSAVYAAAAPLVSSNDATKQSNWYDETEDKSLSAKELLGKTRPSTNTAPSADGTYRGTGNYQSFVRKNPDAPTKQFGPTKASTNVRTITITDMAPDVCVDYKKSGFCGFGDSCKFAHMREDYQHGWELDRDWEIKTKGKKVAGQTVSSREKRDKGAGDDDEYDDKLLESIPFACIICKKSYKNPIITKCGHYFCESCALQRYRKNPSCAACGAGTGGVFNMSKKLNQLLDKKRERARKRREEAIANGEEVEGGEEEEAIEAGS